MREGAVETGIERRIEGEIINRARVANRCICGLAAWPTYWADHSEASTKGASSGHVEGGARRATSLKIGMSWAVGALQCGEGLGAGRADSIDEAVVGADGTGGGGVKAAAVYALGAGPKERGTRGALE